MSADVVAETTAATALPAQAGLAESAATSRTPSPPGSFPPIPGSRLAQLLDLERRLHIEIEHEQRMHDAHQRARLRRREDHRRRTDPTPAEVRAWAATAGLTVGARGRVPDDVRQAYLDAHREEVAPGT